MKGIVIGAGRGSRLMPTTADTPKCFAEVGGKRILDWTEAAFAANGLKPLVFIGGYRIEVVREAYPHFTFCHNDRWPDNNILASLMYAAEHMDGGFVCSYSDILVRPEVIRDLLAHPADLALGVDVHWKDRYAERTQHPPDDAEKVTVANGRVTRVHREIPEAQAHGEFIGVAKFSAAGAKRLKEHYRLCHEAFSGKPFREAKVFEKAYLIHILQDMIEAEAAFAHVDTAGGYMEIDTQEDFELARRDWR